MATVAVVNVLLITLDQFRGDTLSAAGHPLVRTPHLDRLAADGVRMAHHYSQAAPCAPGRASLYTGLYQCNHRVVANGTPLDDRFDNVARAARRAGYRPAVFGYTDQAIDPRTAAGPDDPRLRTYEGFLPGFDVGLDLTGEMTPWQAHLEALGHPVGGSVYRLLGEESTRPAEHSVSAFLTDRLLAWVDHQDGPWFAHASYLRPHPPYDAAGHWAHAYDPADVPPAISAVPADRRHPFHRVALAHPEAAAPADPDAVRRMRAQYYGMVSEVDAQVGRVRAHLEANGQWDDTFVVVTADHADLLGDHGLQGKQGWWGSSYHVLGIVRDPRPGSVRGAVVEELTENVDVLPTLCEAMGIAVPTQCDGLPWTPFLQGEAPPWWRSTAHWEFDWRDLYPPPGPDSWPWDRRLERQNLAVSLHRDPLAATTTAYVQFADGTSLTYDLTADPTWRTLIDDPVRSLALARIQLAWRAQHTDRTMTGTLLDGGIRGRTPVDASQP